MGDAAQARIVGKPVGMHAARNATQRASARVGIVCVAEDRACTFVAHPCVQARQRADLGLHWGIGEPGRRERAGEA